MKYRIILLALLSLTAFAGRAQRKVIVYDLETRTPLRRVLIWADRQLADSTDYRGQAMLPARFDTLLVSRPGYIALRIPAKSVSDSIPLLSKMNSISEVIVYGEDRTKAVQAAVDRWTKEERAEYALRHPKTGVSFDLQRLFDFRGRRARKQRKRMEQLFRQTDARENDPIIRAYRATIKEVQP
ncbi:MAG: hypothetical protein MSD82_11305 [Prevotella sp.]|nr:hypothetical protein [Prevotella sp.]